MEKKKLTIMQFLDKHNMLAKTLGMPALKRLREQTEVKKRKTLRGLAKSLNKKTKKM